MISTSLSAALGRRRILFCLFACVCVAAFFVLADGAFAHEGGEGSVVVHITKKGFEPRSVEISAGDTVVFENGDDEGHWPASDSHPTHEEYSAFDPKKPIQPNQQWSFTFKETGEWEYHDHMNPYLMGNIAVEEPRAWGGGLLASVGAFFANAYETAAAAFGGDKGHPHPASAGGDEAVVEGQSGASPEKARDERYEAKKEEFLTLAREENPRVALDRVRTEIETDDDLSRSCHSLVHEMGREAYKRYGDFGEAMKYRDELCNSGYLHGIIETKFSQSKDVFKDMQTLCEGYRQGGYMGWQCYHGIGHGAMFYTANDLPRSLEMCDAYEEDFGRSSCANGVFMENFNTEQKDHVSEFLKESDPLYPCPKQAERHKADCYTYAPIYYLSLNEKDYDRALEWCEGAEAGFESACAYGVGMQTMKENLNEPEFVESICAGGEPEQRAPCVQGMAGLYVSHHGSLEPARELCTRLEPSNRPACYDSVEAYSGMFADRSS